MVKNEKLPAALYALNGVLVLARSMAYSSRSGDEIAQVLDIAEYLPRLLAENQDRTDDFRRFLVQLAQADQDFQLAVDRFDGEVPEAW